MLAFLQAAKGEGASSNNNETPAVAPAKIESDDTQVEEKKEVVKEVVDEHEMKREEFSNLTDYGPLLEELNRIEQMHVNTVALWVWNKERFKETVQFYITKYNTAHREKKEVKSVDNSDDEVEVEDEEGNDDAGMRRETGDEGNDPDKVVADEDEIPLSRYDDLPITKEVKDYFGVVVVSPKRVKDDVDDEYDDDSLVINTEFNMSHLEELDYEEHMRYLVSDKRVVDHLSRYPFHAMPKPTTKRAVERSKKPSVLTSDMKFFEECNPWPIKRGDDDDD
jgi:hypothetical protein